MKEIPKDSEGNPLDKGFYFDKHDIRVEYFEEMMSDVFANTYSVGDHLHHRPIDYITKHWVKIDPQVFLEFQKRESVWLEQKLSKLEQVAQTQPSCTEGSIIRPDLRGHYQDPAKR
mgnify:CR=1 FL=1